MANNKRGDLVWAHNSLIRQKSVSREIPLQGTKTFNGQASVVFFAFREHKFNDEKLYWTIYNASAGSPINSGHAKLIVGPTTEILENDIYLRNLSILFSIDNGYLLNGQVNTRYRIPYGGPVSGWAGNSSGTIMLGNTNLVIKDNHDLPNPSNPDANLHKGFTSYFAFGYQVEDDGLNKGNWTVPYYSNSETGLSFYYPPYRPFGPDPDPDGGGWNPNPGKPITNETGASGTSDCISLNRQYTIIKADSSHSCNLSWSPNVTSFTVYGQTWKVETRMVRGSTEIFGWQQKESPYTVYGNTLSTGSSYNYYVQRRSPDEGTAYQSNTITLYTYSIPTLSNLSVSPTSQRANAEIKLTYTRNNKTHNIEQDYKTVIWSNYKNSYINETSRNASRTLTSNDLKTLFPDTKANNKGITTGTVYVRRDNIGVSGGNPSSGIVHSSSTLSSNISIYYTPQYKVDKSSLTKRKTNSGGYLYDLTDTVHDDYSFENLYFGWTHDSTSNTAGEVDGYRIVFIDSDGQRYSADVAGGRNVSGNDGYHKDAVKGYTVNMDNIRHMTNQKIEITPYYNASNGTKWYGPSQTWDIGIVVKRLNKPLISYWINKKFRVLFELPEDPDYARTSYTGDSQYHYNNIELCINDVWYLKIRNYNYNNAQNANWGVSSSKTNINAFSSNVTDSNDNNTLIYKKKILIEPDIEPTFPTGYNHYDQNDLMSLLLLLLQEHIMLMLEII